MKTKEQIYQDTREMVNRQDKANYLAYYKVFLENSSRNDIPTEEKESIILNRQRIKRRYGNGTDHKGHDDWRDLKNESGSCPYSDGSRHALPWMPLRTGRKP